MHEIGCTWDVNSRTRVRKQASSNSVAYESLSTLKWLAPFMFCPKD